MVFIREIPIEASTDRVRKLYKDDLRTLGYVANSTKVFTLRPDVHASWLKLLESIRAHMSPRRYELVALAVEAQLHRSALKPESAISGGELSAYARDHHYDPLCAAETAVMAFAARVTLRAHGIDRHAADVLRAQGFLDSEILDIGLAASARCFWSTVLDAVGEEPDEQSMTFDEGFRRALVTGRPTEVTAAKVKRPIPVRQDRRRARADYGPLRRKAIAASLGVVVLGGGIVMAGVSRRAVREHAATPKAAVIIPSSRPAPTETATVPVPAPLALDTTSRCSMTEVRTWLDGSCWSLMKSGSGPAAVAPVGDMARDRTTQ
jgi:alkylhydroperoxidase family enzyme